MKNIKTATCRKNITHATTGRNLPEKTTYTIGGKSFVVEPRYKESGAVTIGTILLKLMRANGAKA